MKEGITEPAAGKLKTWRPGEPVDSRALNETNLAVERLRAGLSSRQVPRAAVGSSGASMFKVSAVAGDYILCLTFDGSTTGTQTIAIAKPYLLRTSVTSRNSITYSYASNVERTATGAAGTETQVVVPSYVVGDVVFAIQTPQRGTGVTFPISGGVTSPITWLDLNVDARAWAKESA